MAELLLELFSEEIPARMQVRAADDLARLLGDGLKQAGLSFDTVRSFATPRRLTVVADGLPLRCPKIKEERKGPRVTAPDAAIKGFLKAGGLTSIDQAESRTDKKGDYYVALIERGGRATSEVVAEIVPEIVRSFPWPKSMHWGARHKSRLVTEDGNYIVTESGDYIVVESWLSWVRPLHSILCLLGSKVVPFEIDGIKSGKETRGHRSV
jgi:glycyl-tRNA synthetase beta chain